MGIWRELVRVAGCDADVTVVEVMRLTAAFLRIAARTKDETRVDYRDASKSLAIDQVIGVVSDLLARSLAKVPSELLPGSVAVELCDALDERTIDPLRHGVIAFVTAQCLDARFGRTFVDAFRARSGESLQEDSPIPVVPFPAASLTNDKRHAVLAALAPRTGDPRKRADAVDRTDHLRLAPRLDDLRVRLIWADPWLDAVDGATRFGAAITNHAPLDHDFDWTTYTVGTRSVFYDVRPKDLAAQRARIEAALSHARREQATIVVLPELCTTHALFEELSQRGSFEEFPLVVAGSYHEPVAPEAPGANVCNVFANGALVYSHRKFSDFYIKDCHEHLAREDGAAGFDVLISPGCSVVVLICKDTFGKVGDLVQELAPTLLLVPAMSPETVDFELLARRLAHDPQSFTLVACAGPEANAVFGRPSQKSPVIAGGLPPGQCAIFSPGGAMSHGETKVK